MSSEIKRKVLSIIMMVRAKEMNAEGAKNLLRDIESGISTGVEASVFDMELRRVG